MKIIKLQAENIKKLKAVEITPDGNMVVISGRNEQGKTSILDSIWYALGGADALKGVAKPIREGEKTAKVTLDLGELTVTRTWTEKGSYLRVGTKDGAEYKSPQKILDGFIGQLSFDPLAFSNMDDKRRREVLLDLVKIDLDLNAWGKERQVAYDERTVVNRKVKELGVKINGLPAIPEGTPDEEVSAATILQEQAAAQKVKEANDEQRRGLEDLQDERDDLHNEYANREVRIKKLEAEIKELQTKQVQVQKALVDKDYQLANQKKKVAALVDPDLSIFSTKIATVEETNRAVRAKAARVTMQTELKTTQASANALTDTLSTLDQKKVDAIKGAQFPIEGLGFDDDGVTYKGIPFSQCSSAERLRVSLAMAMALNPKIRVLRITDGSLLDNDHMQVIRQMVEAQDYQLWIERVDDTGKVGLIIEDGLVVGHDAPAQTCNEVMDKYADI